MAPVVVDLSALADTTADMGHAGWSCTNVRYLRIGITIPEAPRYGSRRSSTITGIVRMPFVFSSYSPKPPIRAT